MPNIHDKINQLYNQDNDSYMVDFVPFTFPNEDYFDLEIFLDKHYKADFAKKIIFIAFAVMYYYDSQVYFNSIADVSNPIFEKYDGKDLRHNDLEELNKLINTIIMEGYGVDFDIIFKHDKTESMMCIAGDYSVYFFNLTGDAYNNIKQMIEHAGLYLKPIDNEEN